MDDIVQITYDIYNLARYIFSNIADLFTILFTPLIWLFNFIKGFFIGIATPPPATAITWVFPDNIMAVFNAIPYFGLLEWACGAALSIFVLIFVFKHIAAF
jgi:hypothetical protein